MTERRGPRTEEKLLSHFVWRGRADREDLNQSRTVPVFRNHEEDETIRCYDARGQEDRYMLFLRAYGIDEVVMDIQKSRFSRVLFAVCRLVRI